MGCNPKHRHSRALAVEQAVDEMQVAGSAASGADREGVGQMGFGPGGKSGDFFVTDVKPLDLALLADGVGKAVQAVADDAIDALYAGCGEGFGKLFGNGGHGIDPDMWEKATLGGGGREWPAFQPWLSLSTSTMAWA